jgi:hypothetical protein
VASEPSTPHTQAVLVPADFVVYRCKIGGGRVIQVALPPRFSARDAALIYGFLLSQVDEEEVSRE